MTLIPCRNTKCNNYDENFKCHCDIKTYLSVRKCKKFISGKKIEFQDGENNEKIHKV